MVPHTFMGFSDAQLYADYHSLQTKDAKLALDKYKSLIKWNNMKKVIDVGCGPGDTTKNQILPLIPKNALLLAIDISPQMVEHAKSKNTDPRLHFEMIDFGTSTASEKYPYTFDLVTSFYVFHFIHDKRTPLQNVYNILKKGGETLIILVVTCPVYTQLEALASNPKWSPYLQGVKEYISPYYHCNDPEAEIINILQDIGFHVKDSVLESKTFDFKMKEYFLKWALAVNSVASHIPKHLFEEFVEEYQQKMWTAVSNEPIFPYTTITVYAQKPF